ncbi:MAG: glycosyltransferase family 9 protein [Bacteroidota bacterium]
MKTLIPKFRHAVALYTSFSANVFRLVWIRLTKERGTPLLGIFLLEHLGDIVACEPVSRQVRQVHPNAIIIWCVKKGYRELLDGNPYITRVCTLHCLTERSYIANSGLFDDVIDLHFPERYCSLCNRNVPVKAMKRSEIALNNFYRFGNIAQSFARYAGLSLIDDTPHVYISDYAEQKILSLKLPATYITVHCATNAEAKDWRREKWEAFSQRFFAEYNISIIEVGTEATMNRSSSSMYLNMCGRLSILETASVIRMSALFIGVDSGPAHLANAVGTYGVLLMGPFLGFKRYNPFGGSYRNQSYCEIIYNHTAVAEISVEEVFAAAARRIRTLMS